MSEPAVSFLRTDDGARLAHWSVGTGPPLLYLPMPAMEQTDLSWRDSRFAQWIGQLAQHRRVTFADWRGLGQSDPGEDLEGGAASYLALSVRDVDTLLNEVAPGEPATLVSTYGGAAVAIVYAVGKPERVRELILINGYANSSEFRERTLATQTRSLAAEDPQQYAIIAAGATAGSDPQPGTIRHLREIIERNWRALSDFPGLASAMQGGIDAGDAPDSVRVPTLVLQARNIAWMDPSVGKQLASEIPGAALQFVDGDTLLPYLSGADGYLRHIRTFWNVPAPAPAWVGSFSTVLFTDVVSSTPLLTQLHDERMREVMRNHDAVCEAAITEHGGRVVKTIGDAFMAEFSVPSAAIDAAIAIQRGIREEFTDPDVPVQLRIGVNAGEPIVEDDDLHGASVVIAKRLESEADDGGILVSDVVRQAVAGKDFEFEARGEVDLTGFDEPVRAWSVRWDE